MFSLRKFSSIPYVFCLTLKKKKKNSDFLFTGKFSRFLNVCNIKKFLSSLVLFLTLNLCISHNIFADVFNIKDLYSNTDKNFTLYLNDSSEAIIYYDPKYREIAVKISKKLKETHDFYENLLGVPKDLKLTFKIMDKNRFFQVTKIPEWINAIYYKKHIIFPLSPEDAVFSLELLKSLRHEYMHAFIYNLSNGNCVSWLDEGLAQWSEGTTNPRLWNELKSFLKNHNALSLSNISGGYTVLPTSIVPIAYAESLFSVKFLINNFKISKFQKLFSYLKEDVPFNESFKMAFNLGVEDFDFTVTSLLYNWKNSSQKKSFDNFINFSNENNFDTIMARMKNSR